MRWAVLVVALICCLGAEAFPKRRHKVRYDLTPIALATSGQIPLMGGGTLALPALWSKRRIYFEDLQPGANWGHDARVRIEDNDGRLAAQIKLRFPPRDLATLEVLGGTPPVPSKPPEFKIGNAKGVHRVADPDKYWAYLLNGDAEQRHWNDYAYLYRVLVEVYGYLPSHILVGDGLFRKRKPDLDDNGTSDINYGSTHDEVKRAFGFLNSTLKKSDRLLFVVNDHGGIVDGESTIVLSDVELKASEFLPLMATLPNQETISVFAQCNAGGFVRPSIAQGRVAVAASTDLELSWATTDFQFDEFLYHFTAAIGFQRHDGTPVSADSDGDGKVSVKEAFVYAQAADKSPESPFLESFTNTGKAMDIGVGY